jgi:hypothetical protein
MTYYEENNSNKKQSILIYIIILPLYIVNIIFGVKYLDDTCTSNVSEISFKFPLWLIINGSIGCLKLILAIINSKDLINIIGLFDLLWFIIGNILFWNGTLDCTGELYKLGFANMIIGYILIFLAFIFGFIFYRIVRNSTNSNPAFFNV